MANYKNEFPFFESNPGIAYLDNANTTQIHKSVLDAINAFYTHFNYNIGRAGYRGARQMAQIKEWAQLGAAKFLNAKKEQIIFTSGATEGLNLVASSFVYWGEKQNKKFKVLTTKLEHASLFLPWLDSKKAEFSFLKLNNDYTFNLDFFKEELEKNLPDVVLLSSMTNTTGEVRPLEEIGKLCKQYGVVFIVDHAQGAAHVQIDVEKMNIDFLAFSLHKMYGPKGLGVLFAKNPFFLKPSRVGGGMNKWFTETNMEYQDSLDRFYAGTENLEALCGAVEIFNFFEENWGGIKSIELYFGTFMYKLLQKIPNIEIYSVPNSTIFLFNIKDIEALDVMNYLDRENICIRAGNHCSKLTKELFGLSTCRVSLGVYNDENDLAALYHALKKLTEEEICQKSVQEEQNAELKNVEQMNAH